MTFINENPNITDWSELDALLDGMTFPERRAHDLGWLRRNIVIYNLDHPNFPALLVLIGKLEDQK